MILAGDIGGTKTRLAFFEAEAERLTPLVEDTVASREHSSLDEIVHQFVAKHSLKPTQACFGIAGPVKHGRSVATNLPWLVEAQALASALGLASVGLLNDLEANAYGMAALAPEDLVVLNAGEPEAGNAALIAAGTGLGEAGLYWDGERHRPFASEGGHADFAPSHEPQLELLRYLLGRFQRVSWERVLSGPGLYNLYQFLRDTGSAQEPAWLTEELSLAADPPAVITQAALTHRSPLCEQTLELFVSLYGAEAGNLALKVMATGGVWVGGGIAPRIIERLKGPAFLQAFVAKGRLQPVLEAMPVRVILNDKTALLGAALYAAQHG